MAWLAVFLTLAVALPAEEVRHVRVGLEFNSPPLSFMNKQRQLQGFTVELLQEMERAGGFTVECVPGSWLQLSEAFTAGQIDVLANVIITPERRATMAFSIGHASLHASAYTRPGSASITRTADLAGKKIAILAGSVASRNAVQSRGWGGETVMFSNFRTMLDAVNSGACDVALVLRPLSFEQPDELGLRRELVEDFAHRFHLAVHRDDRETLEQLNEALAVVRANGVFDRLYAKWIGPIEPRPIGLRDLRPYFLPASAGGLLVGLLFVWQRRVNGALARQADALHASEDRLRKSLGEKEALLKEVHHRVKNNLQVVTSLLRLEAGRSVQTTTRTVLQEMTGRIRTMALLHETLYRSGDFGRLDLAAYLRQLATQAFRLADHRAGAVQLHLELSAASVELDQAIPCGLIVNELLTNSLKHGFPEARSGAVRLELSVVDGGDSVRLRVSDDGVGLPADFAERRRTSLGLELVSDLARQIDGKLTIGPGAAFTVVFSRSRSVSKTLESPIASSTHASPTHSHS